MLEIENYYNTKVVRKKCVALDQRENNRSMEQTTEPRGHSYIAWTFDSWHAWNCVHPSFPSYKEGSIVPDRSVGVMDTVYSTPGKTVPTHTQTIEASISAGGGTKGSA